MHLVSRDVEGDEMVMVKYVHRGKDNDHILLVSENKHYSDKEFYIQHINEMALVKASVRFNSLTNIMKKNYLFVLIALLSFSISNAQKRVEKIDSYTASNGVTYEVGDDIELGRGSDTNGR